MKYSRFTCIILALALIACGHSEVEIPLSEGEVVWGGQIKMGSKMPYEPGFEASLCDNMSNQVAPLLLTSMGRYVWSETPFDFKITDKAIIVSNATSEIRTLKAGETLQDAFKSAAESFFPADGNMPPQEFFRVPQYNTWIELLYNQNQDGVLSYAHGILDNGLPAGIIMIDDTWQEDYGKWFFHPGKFPDPKSMVDELHNLGFKVMLWVCPFVSMDQYLICREILSDKGFLMKGAPTWEDAWEPYPVRWWNGTSAVLDFSNPKAVEWFEAQLQRLMDDYGIDGFKFDAADFIFYPSDAMAKGGDVPGYEQCDLFVKMALKYPYNELRAGWRNAGSAIVNRLHDKAHSWDDLVKLIPEMMAESLMGFSFCCPDMVGGGSFETFLSGNADQDLIVRSAQIHALMPMIQFSLAPWRVLDEEHYAAVLKAVQIRETMLPYIEELYKRAAKTGEPIVAPMEYVFPHQGMAQVKDQFVLGDNIIVAPMVSSGTSREVVLPEGRWRAADGAVYEAGTHSINVPIDSLPYFERI